jgi:hypothetical protein
MRTELKMMVMVVALGLSAQASLVVDYDGHATNNEQARTADSATSSGQTWNFSTSSALITAPGQNGKIYGGLVTAWGATTNYTPLVRDNKTPVLEVTVNPTASATENASAKGMLVWNKADFLTGSVQTVTFAGGDSLYLNISGWAATAKDVRFTINQGGVWYVSDSKIASGTAQSWTLDPTTNQWRTISTDGNYTIGGSASSVNFSNVLGAGIYLDSATVNGAQMQLLFNDFKVNATVIPEPATIGMLGLGALVVVIVRRMKS